MEFVRYFNLLIDPAQFRRGYGFLGFIIFLLNKVRLFLEKQIVLWIAKQHLAEFHPKDELEGRLAEVKAHFKAPVLQREQDPPATGNRTDRYLEGRKNTEPEKPVPIKDGPLSYLIARVSDDRAARYYQGRNHLVYEQEDDSDLQA